MPKTRLYQPDLPACFPTVQTIIAVNTGNKITNVTPQADLAADLGMNLNVDLPEIILNLNQEYSQEKIDLDPDEVYHELQAVGLTVLELAKLVEEVRKLG